MKNTNRSHKWLTTLPFHLLHMVSLKTAVQQSKKFYTSAFSFREVSKG